MREIKFRAWDKVIKIMVTQDSDLGELDVLRREAGQRYSIYTDDEWQPAFEIWGIFNYFQDIVQNEELIVMQFTGLWDKNECEIWEGDVVAFVDEERPFVIGHYRVDWYDCMFCLSPHEDDYGFVPALKHHIELKQDEGFEVVVVGNIYEGIEQ